MAATITGAIKALLASSFPTAPVFAEQAGTIPSTGPWFVVHEGISRIPAQAEGRGVRLRRELVQVDVWQHSATFDPSVPLTVERVLDASYGAALSGGDSIVRFRPENTHRAVDQAAATTADQITVAAARHLT